MNLSSLLAAAGSGRPAGAHGTDRRRQVRLDGAGAGAAHRRAACGRRRRSRRRQGARLARPGRLAGGALQLPASLGEAVKTGKTCVLDDAAALAACPEIECIVEATGHPIAGVRHALAAIEGGKHLVMVNVEADVLCGPLLAARARAKGPRLQHGLWRPAGHHLRAGGLGPLLRLRADLGRQGHEFRAALPLFDARYRLGLLRLDRGGSREGRLQPEDVQLVHRRHEGGDRDGGGRQRHRPRLPG